MTDSEDKAKQARQRAADAKEREIKAHQQAVERHEAAARLQERLGHPDLAAAARARADHARALGERAQSEKDAVAPPPRREPVRESGARHRRPQGNDVGGESDDEENGPAASAVTLREDEGVADTTAG